MALAPVIYDHKVWEALSPNDQSLFLPIQQEQFEQMDKLFHRNDAIQSATNTAMRHLLGAGLVFQKSGFEISSEERDNVHAAWTQYCEEYWTHVFKYGTIFVIVGVDNVPHVMQPSMFTIRMNFIKDQRRSYHIQNTTDPKFLTKKHKVYCFEHKPPEYQRLGSRYANYGVVLQSLIKPLLRIDEIVSSKIADAMVASHRRARPSLFTASVMKDVTAARTLTDYAVDGDANQTQIDSTEKQRETFEQITTHNEEFTQEVNAQRAGLYTGTEEEFDADAVDPVTGGPVYPRHRGNTGYSFPLVPLPDGRTSVPGPIPEEPTDLRELMQEERQQVYEAFGMPHDTMGGTGKSYQAVNVGLLDEQETAITQMRQKSVHMLQYLFQQIHGLANAKHAFENKKKGESNRELAERSKIRVSFRPKPNVEVIKYLFDSHAIDSKTFISAIAPKVGMAEIMFDEKQLTLFQSYRLEILRKAAFPPKPKPGEEKKKEGAGGAGSAAAAATAAVAAVAAISSKPKPAAAATPKATPSKAKDPDSPTKKKRTAGGAELNKRPQKKTSK